jgi:hypothetical protein
MEEKSCAVVNRAIGRVYRQVFNAYLNFPNADALPSGKNVFASWLAARVALGGRGCSKSPVMNRGAG